MKKQLFALAMSTALIVPTTTSVFAETAPVANESNSEATIDSSNVVITTLPPEAGKILPSTNESGFQFSKSAGTFTPQSTDGQNLFFDYGPVSNQVRSTALPAHRSGQISLKLVQTTLDNSNQAYVQYQFANQSGSKKSSVIAVSGNISSPARNITFTNVPKGTASDPIYLYITNAIPKNSGGYRPSITGNGQTL